MSTILLLVRLSLILPAINIVSAACSEGISGGTARNNNGVPKSVWTTEWSNDGKYIAVAGDDSVIWSKDGVLIHEAKTAEVLWGMDWNKEGTHIATGSFGDGSVRIWSAKAELIRKIN